MDMTDTKGLGGAAAVPSGEGQGREGPEGETCARERDFLMGLLLSMEEQRYGQSVA